MFLRPGPARDNPGAAWGCLPATSSHRKSHAALQLLVMQLLQAFHFASVVQSAVAGCVLVAMGVLLFTCELQRLNIEAQNALDGLGLNFFKSV